MPPGPIVIERMRRWIESLPPTERDMVYLHTFGRYWTPRQVLDEMERGTPEGLEFQRMEERLLKWELERKRREGLGA